jgi:hypothetical protein
LAAAWEEVAEMKVRKAVPHRSFRPIRNDKKLKEVVCLADRTNVQRWAVARAAVAAENQTSERKGLTRWAGFAI